MHIHDRTKSENNIERKQREEIFKVHSNKSQEHQFHGIASHIHLLLWYHKSNRNILIREIGNRIGKSERIENKKRLNHDIREV